MSTNGEIHHPALLLEPSPALDLAVDEIVLGIVHNPGKEASRRWSWDQDTASVLYDPLHKSEDWTLQYDVTGHLRYGWFVQNSQGKLVAKGSMPQLAMIRAVLIHHLMRRGQDAAPETKKRQAKKT